MQAMLIDALDRFRACTSADERWRCGAGLLTEAGSDWLTAGSAAPGPEAAVAVRSSTPSCLMRDYVDQRLYLDDPWMQLCAISLSPDVMDITRDSGPQGRPGKARVSRLFADHGVSCAILMPCYGGPRTGGMVLYARSASAAEWLSHSEGMAQASLLVAVLACHYRPDADDSDSPQQYHFRNPLSAREREVLSWLSSGLRTARIAERLGLSEVTVNKHLQSARRKLRARTREQALVIAVRDGLIRV